jgi:hypothetical protein
MKTPSETTITLDLAITHKVDTYQTSTLLNEKVTTQVPGSKPTLKATRSETLAALRSLRDTLNERFDALIEEEEEAAEAKKKEDDDLGI